MAFRDANGMFVVNGTVVPIPDQFEIKETDVDDQAFRDAQTATDHRHRITTKVKLVCCWSLFGDPLEAQELCRLLGNLPEYFNVTYPHHDGSQKTIRVYRSAELSSKMYRLFGSTTGWKQIKCNFIEQ